MTDTAQAAANTAADAVVEKLIDHIREAQTLAKAIHQRHFIPQVDWIIGAVRGIKPETFQGRLVIRAFELGAGTSSDMAYTAKIRENSTPPDGVEVADNKATYRFNTKTLSQGEDILSKAFQLGQKTKNFKGPWITAIKRLLEHAVDVGDLTVHLECEVPSFEEKQKRGDSAYTLKDTNLSVVVVQEAMKQSGITCTFSREVHGGRTHRHPSLDIYLE